ncbi:nucleotide sugar dehydrogenase [Staphylococcus hominis]|uniref:Nucleotide sugar dehydrogenase n=1 Tax=Staphylococcus hominis TaxID=1290 RepID=A0A8X8KJJ3_STAHO|nr:nucleotide sugar dehydrogenase [Staphylococcus hominis]MBK1407226.1 nucleotide sugar dehydrogenase [Staphylococcus hominis]MCM5673270.1 nucleotide sugar dehydrogenase [Staphylococcus hominis]PNZ81211.1 nucleotide sugar dehydrogenase [Staphylococcus hominis subsp. novobiosepticus]
MDLFNKLINKEEKLAVVGLGYVGMPIALAFSEQLDVIGFDTNKAKIDLYKSGIDPTSEVGDEKIKNSNLKFTSDESELKNSKFIIVAVPTPINRNKTPDLTPVESASKIIGKNLTKGSVVVYESTVYPGVTEDICLPILEKESGLTEGVDFYIGYSPERINPGDKKHKLENIVKIVSSSTNNSIDLISKVYELVVKVGVYKASSIKVAEAAKVVENSQRDINIAFMNELAMVFDKMNIDTNEVIKAMNTKWNSLNFYPGLVGGHCIGVDPYYFIYEAEKLGYHSKIVLSGRKINENMSKYVAETAIKKIIEADKKVKNANILILGVTFKENTPDTRNSKIIDTINYLKEYGVNIKIVDPVADKDELKLHHNLDLVKINQVKDIDCIIYAVGHDEIKKLKRQDFNSVYKDDKKIILDIKSNLNKDDFLKDNYIYWNL